MVVWIRVWLAPWKIFRRSSSVSMTSWSPFLPGIQATLKTLAPLGRVMRWPRA